MHCVIRSIVLIYIDVSSTLSRIYKVMNKCRYLKCFYCFLVISPTSAKDFFKIHFQLVIMKLICMTYSAILHIGV